MQAGFVSFCDCPNVAEEKTSLSKVVTPSKFGKGLGKCQADTIADHQVRIIILVGWRPVKDCEFGTLSFGQKRESLPPG